MSEEFQVKGSSIRSKFEFVRERFGEAAERKLMEGFRHRPGMLGATDLLGIEALDWNLSWDQTGAHDQLSWS